jgi:hypothetical protein
MNIDRDRDRCKIPDLDQKKLRRVAFCVDVEIAGISRRESDEESPTGASDQKVKRPSSKAKDKDDSKRPQPDVAEKEKRRQENGTSPQHPAPSETPSTDTKHDGVTKEPTRKQEKKKRSDEERRERKERKRRQAEANCLTYAVTPYARAISCCSSTLTLVKVIRFGRESCLDSCSYAGAIALHGPHQSA